MIPANLDHFKDEHGYYQFSNQILSQLEQDNISLEEQVVILKEIALHNKEIYYDLLKRNYKKEKKTEKIIDSNQENQEIISSTKKERQNQIDVSSYLEKLYLCDITDYIYDILPNPYDPFYNQIVTKIQLSLLSAKKEAYDFLFEIQDSSSEDYSYIQEEIQKIDAMLEEIRICIEEKNEENNILEIIPTEEKRNHIIFLKSNGTNQIERDIKKNVSPQLYPLVLSLLSSIEVGYFPRIKTYNSNLLGIRAIRKNDLRILFQQLDDTTYIILSIFTKKCATSQQYHNDVNTTREQFLRWLELLPYHIGSKEWNSFIEEETKDLESITSLLSSPTTKEKKKGGIL